MADMKCATCGASIMWRQHATTGKQAPVDTVSNPAGNIVLLGRVGYRVLTKAEREQVTEEPRFTNHWQTCPHADYWRTKR